MVVLFILLYITRISVMRFWACYCITAVKKLCPSVTSGRPYCHVARMSYTSKPYFHNSYWNKLKKIVISFTLHLVFILFGKIDLPLLPAQPQWLYIYRWKTTTVDLGMFLREKLWVCCIVNLICNIIVIF